MRKRYPFKFLDSYTKEDKDFFFGRKPEVDQLYKMIFKTKILVIYGTSGTGKTSLIQCGLANKFESYDWLALNVRRGSNLIESLDDSLLKSLNDHDGKSFVKQGDYQKGINELTSKIEALYKSSFRPIYFIFDQFEELFVKDLGTKKEQALFISTIKEILSVDRPIKIILSIREEYLGYLYEFEKEIPMLLQKKLRVESMTKDKVKEVLKGINKHKDDSLVTIKPEELDLITEEIFKRLKGKEKNSHTIQLPYLQVYLDKLYMNHTKDDWKHKTEAEINMSDVNAIGDIDDVMQDFLVEQVKQIGQDLRDNYKLKDAELIIWSILSKFVTLEGTKEPVSIAKLVEIRNDIDQDLLHESVDQFEKRRILRRMENSDLYELSHDSLALKIIERIDADDTKKLEVKNFIKGRASQKGEFRVLFNEKELNMIEAYLNKLQLVGSEKAFIKESQKKIETDLEKEAKDRKKEEARKRHKAYRIFGALIVALLVGGVFLQREFLRGEIRNDALIVKRIIESTELKLREADTLKVTDPTGALIHDRNTMVMFLNLENEEPYQKLKNNNYIWMAKLLGMSSFISDEFEKVDLLKDNVCDKIEEHGKNLLKENQALYKIIDFSESEAAKDSTNDYSKDYTISGPQALNMIFTDSKEDHLFRLWSADTTVVKALNKIKNKSYQIVFPLDTSEAMVLSDIGKAHYMGKNKAYRPLNMSKVPFGRYGNRPLKITSIAPINYEIIGYKMLSALNNEKIVQWDLNGTIRYNDSTNVKAVIYDKGNIQLGDSVVSIAISPKRHKIFTATDNGIGIIWLADTSRVVLPKESKLAFSLEQDIIMCSSFSKDGNLIATGSKDHSISIWNDKGKLIKKLKGHKTSVTSVAFSANTKFLYSGSVDGNYIKWIIPTKVLNEKIDYKSIKWHSYSSFQQIYEIDKYEKINYYKIPKTLPDISPLSQN